RQPAGRPSNVRRAAEQAERAAASSAEAERAEIGPAALHETERGEHRQREEEVRLRGRGEREECTGEGGAFRAQAPRSEREEQEEDAVDVCDADVAAQRLEGERQQREDEQPLRCRQSADSSE